jgi:hypothetical protein
MALKNVNTAEEGTGSSVKYTGLAILDVIGINPSKESLEKIGIKPKEEPIYLVDKVDSKTGDEFKSLRLTFFMSKTIGEGNDAHDIIVNYSIFLEARYNISTAGKYELIDKFGKSCYVEKSTIKTKSWESNHMDKDSTNPAIVGESSLINFFRTIANSGKNEEMVIADLCPDSDRKKLFLPNGSKEIKSCLHQVKSANPGNVAKIKMLLGIRIDHENQRVYQDVFSYHIGRVYANADYFHKQLFSLNERKPEFFNSNHYGDINLRSDRAVEQQYTLSVYNNDPFKTEVTKSLPGSMSSNNSAKGNDFDDDFDNDSINQKDTSGLENRMSSSSEEEEEDPLF